MILIWFFQNIFCDAFFFISRHFLGYWMIVATLPNSPSCASGALETSRLATRLIYSSAPLGLAWLDFLSYYGKAGMRPNYDELSNATTIYSEIEIWKSNQSPKAEVPECWEDAEKENDMLGWNCKHGTRQAIFVIQESVYRSEH